LEVIIPYISSQRAFFGEERSAVIIMDISIYTLQNYYPLGEILHSDFKPYSIDDAIKETLIYFINSNEDKKTFSWTFGLPCSSNKMAFKLYTYLPTGKCSL
jgi:hypothetical protein